MNNELLGAFLRRLKLGPADARETAIYNLHLD
jgi:hypothetical protein